MSSSTLTVAKHLKHCINHQRKSILEISASIGISNPELITMFADGVLKLPMDKVIPIANVLQINSGELFYLVLREYAPDTFEALRPFMQALELSDDEQDILIRYREYKSNIRP